MFALLALTWLCQRGPARPRRAAGLYAGILTTPCALLVPVLTCSACSASYAGRVGDRPLTATLKPYVAMTLCLSAPQPAVGPHTWTAARPPLAEGQVPPVNSWFFVPLLLAGGGLLLQNPERQAAVSQLRRSPPVPLSRFLSVLETLQDVAALDGRRVSAAEALLVPALREAGTSLPTHTLVHFRWVLERCLTPRSYVPASAQEALLQVFLSERVASDLSVLADRLRSGAQPAPPVVPLQPAALTVTDQPLPATERDPSPVLVAPPAPSPLAAFQPARLPPRGFPEEDVGFGTPVPVAQPPACIFFVFPRRTFASRPPFSSPSLWLTAPHPRPAPPLTPRVALMEVRVSRPTRTQPLGRS